MHAKWHFKMFPNELNSKFDRYFFTAKICSLLKIRRYLLSHRGEVLIYLTPKICDAPYSKWLYYYVKDIHWKFILYALAILTVGSAFHAFQNAFPCKCSLKLFSFTGRKMHRRQSNVYFACAINSIGRALVAITT